MKKFEIHFFVILFLFAFKTNAQFAHLKNNEEDDQQVLVVFNDGGTKTGYIKNDKTNASLGRTLSLLTTDLNAFKHTNTIADHILFREEGSNDFNKIDAKNIKQVRFNSSDSLSYDRITVYRFKRKNFELKKDEPEMMFAISQVDDVFKMYSKYYLSEDSTGRENEQYFFFVKLRDSDMTYFFSKSSLVNRAYFLEYFKIFAPDNVEYTTYIDRLKKKGTPEFKEFEEAGKAITSKFMKENNIDKNNLTNEIFEIEYRVKSISNHYNFMFYYMGKKYKEIVLGK